MPDRIAEIRARLDAATPGPWLRHPSEPWVYAEIMGTRAKRIIATEIYKGDRNADLITNAPADIAWLLDEVDRLVWERDAAREWWYRWRRAAWEQRAWKAAE